MINAPTSVADFLNSCFLHWTPAKAIWIGGHTLSWDARCAGIYAGFGAGVLYQLVAHWKAWKFPSARLLALDMLLTLPLFLDVLTAVHGFRVSSNGSRYLTGLLFGSAFSVCLFPAFMLLALSKDYGQRSTGVISYLGPFLALGVAPFFLKDLNSGLVYGVLESLSVFGSLSLLAILGLGLFKAARKIRLPRGVAKGLWLMAMISVFPSCAALPPSTRSDSCDIDSFKPPQGFRGDCKKAVCQDGKVVWAEDLTLTAPVDDWAEEKFCLRHPINCLRAHQLKRQTEKWQKEMDGKYWTKERNSVGDGARHAHLMCVLAERFGDDFARGLGIAHEEDSEYFVFSRKGGPGNPCCEKMMDLYNNEIGIMLARKPGSCEEKVLGSLHLLRHSMGAGKDKGHEGVSPPGNVSLRPGASVERSSSGPQE